MLIIYTDGGARGNPGPAAVGVVFRKSKIKNPKSKNSEAPSEQDFEIIKKIKKPIGHATNNEAEYQAVITAFEEAHKLGAVEVELRLDSKLVGMQLAGKWKIKEPRLRALFVQAWNLKSRFSRCVITVIPREENREADKLVNEALDVGG